MTVTCGFQWNFEPVITVHNSCFVCLFVLFFVCFLQRRTRLTQVLNESVDTAFTVGVRVNFKLINKHQFYIIDLRKCSLICLTVSSVQNLDI